LGAASPLNRPIAVWDTALEMGPDVEPVSTPADPAIVSARAVRLATGAFAPFSRVVVRTVAVIVVSIAAGVIAGFVAPEPVVGTLVSLTILVAAGVVVWWPLTDPAFSGASELFFDHDCHERAEWKAETGTPMPRGLKGAKQWLLANPIGPGRASMLLPLGRLGEADRAIEAMDPKTPEDAFGIEILRATRILYAGGRPDLGPLHATWRSLPDVRERRHRRECLALLDAEIAFDTGGDPIATLATARQEIDGVYWTMRTPWLLAKWLSLALLAIVSATFIVPTALG
jgi:hypothetical protein